MKQINQYLNYTVEDFVDDPVFKTWILQPTPEQKAYWENIVRELPSVKPKIAKAKVIVLQLKEHYQKELPDSTAPDPNFAQMLTKTMEEAVNQTQIEAAPRHLPRRWAIAATIAFLLGLSTWWISQTSDTTRPLITHQTAFAEWKKIELPDGSIVHLNANSELKLNSDWSSGADRQVWLSGEAYFEVERQPQTQAKFNVITDALEVEVLGTMFNVNARGTNTKVFLEEGKIALKTALKNINLVPNDFIDFTKGETALVVQKRTAFNTASWKEGMLLMTQQSVEVILQRLEEIYGNPFQVSDQTLLKEVKTLAVPMDELEVVLPILEKTLDAVISKENGELVINRKPQ